MIKAPFPFNEEQRLKELTDFQILDTLTESKFDDLTSLASTICQSPISLISLIDKDRQWFKSKVGLDANETPRDISFCGHAIMGSDIFEIPDAELDERFQDNPLYTGQPHVRFYAGAPLITKSGFKIGTLCVIDHVPRELNDAQKEALRKLANLVMLLMECRTRENLLREANAKFDAIVNNIPVMLTTYNEEGKFDWMNDEMVQELGWDFKKDSEENFLAKIFPDSHKSLDALTFMLSREKKWHDFKTWKKDGTIIHTAWTNVKIENGKYIGIGNNIHGRKMMESELAKNILRLDYILDCACLGSWEWSLNDNKVIYDKRWCEILGLKQEETLMNLSTWEERIHPEDKIRAEQDILDHIQGKTDHYENLQRIKHASGQWIWVLERGRISERSEDGTPLCMIGTHFDFTNQKNIELSLRDNQEKAMAIFEGSNDAILLFNKDHIFECNKKALQLFNIEKKETLIRLHLADLSPHFQSDGQSSQQLFKEHLHDAIKNDVKHFDWNFIKETREMFPADVLISAFEFQGAKVFQATIRDMTLKNSLKKNLEQQIKITQHQSKLASIGELAAGVGHEINNPLAIIKGFLHVIEDNLKINQYEDDKTYSMLTKIHLASDRIVNIVKGLRTFSRSDSDKIECFDLKDAIDETFNLISEVYQNDGITLINKISPAQEFIVYGNKGRLEQVILNLFSNAKDATEGRLERIIETSVSQAGNMAVWTIKDNGKGIPLHLQNRIFDPFFTTKDVNKGTGIGLSLAHSIITEHDGKISFETIPDKGTIFKIEIPLFQSKSEAPRAVQEIKSENRPQFQLKALIAEDEEDIRMILDLMLSRVGITVTSVKNGQEALKEIQHETYDLLVTDIKMPVMNGKALVEAIRSDKTINQPKIFLMTGGIEEADSTVVGQNHLVQGQIFKPFDPETLYEKIREQFPEKAWT
jgi:PAS domain S-box-containing protein